MRRNVYFRRSYLVLGVLAGAIFGGTYVLESVEPKAGQGDGNQASGAKTEGSTTGKKAEPESIDVTAKGYLPGRTAEIVPYSAGDSGGSYGGLGGSFGGSTNNTYGDYFDPNDVGSGGSVYYGGGLVRLNAGNLQLDGQILASGGPPGGQTLNGGGGSGGGISLNVNSL